MQLAQSSIAASELSAKRKHLSVKTPDAILRTAILDREYKLECAWQGNLTQIINSSGVSVASIANKSAEDAGYPATNVISGSNVHYNPITDLDNNRWATTNAGSTDYVTIDLGSSQAFNEVVVYLHPFLANVTAFSLLHSASAASGFINFYSTTGLATKYIVRLNSTITDRYIRFQADNLAGDGITKVVAIEVYNWVDETSRIVMNGGVPNLNISVKGDQGQNALPNPSELNFSLQNFDGRYSAFNSSSAIYGIAQPDGNGSGVRSGVPVRVSASATDVNGNTFNQFVYSGYITNDNNPGGSTGITYDDTTQTVLFSCKSLYTKLNMNIDVPCFEGATFDYIFRDVCYRCGIAEQDLTVNPVSQGVPWSAFGNQTGTAIINQLLGALPFMRVYESFHPNLTLNVINYGRARQDIDVGRFTGATNIIHGMVNIPGKNLSFIIDVNYEVWKWDMTKPSGQGITDFGTPTNASTCRFFAPYGKYVYYVQSNGDVRHFDTTLGSISNVFDGTFNVVIAGFDTLVTAVMNDKYLYVVMSNGAGGANQRMYVWDVTKPFSAWSSPGQIPAGTIMIGIGYGNFTNNNLAADGTYVIWKYAADSSTGNTITHSIWKHNGVPDTAGAAFNPGTNVKTFSFFSASVIAGEDYTNVCFSYGTDGNLYGAVAILHSGDALRRHEIWNISIATAFTTPATTATKLGTIKDNSSATALVNGIHESSLVLNGTYIYYVDSENTVYVWDTTKAFTYLFNIGIGNQSVIFPLMPFRQGTLFGGCGSMGTQTNTVDFSNKVWYAVSGSVGTGTGLMCAFTVQNTISFPTTPTASFDLSDNSVVNILMSYGNPSCNRVKINTNPFTNAASATQVWNVPTTGILFPSNQKTTVALPMSGISGRGSGASPTTQRYLAINATTIYDDPTTSTNVTISAVVYPVTFFAYGEAAYITLDATGGKAAVTLSPSGNNASITGKVVSQVGVSNVGLDKIDAGSYAMFKKYFVKDINSFLFNDASFYQDYLLSGKYNQPYIQGMDLFWYPIVTISVAVGVTDSLQSISAMLFEAFEYQVNGWSTTIKLKQYLTTFTI